MSDNDADDWVKTLTKVKDDIKDSLDFIEFMWFDCVLLITFQQMLVVKILQKSVNWANMSSSSSLKD